MLDRTLNSYGPLSPLLEEKLVPSDSKGSRTHSLALGVTYN